MFGGIISIIVGVVCIGIGLLNMRGNISMLHSYHINNIKEEDKKPFGKLVGIGMIIVGLSLIGYGALFIVYESNPEKLYMDLANIVLIVGLVIGLVISLFAIKKYNKEIIG